MKQNIRVVISLLLISNMLAITAMADTPQIHVPSHAPMRRAGPVSSTNWGGYAVTGPSGSVTDVKGSWTVPAIQGSCPATNQYASFWTGIDGFNSGTVEQTGTDSDCQNGAPVYYAWFEFYPKPAFLINGLTIHPGDKMYAEVQNTRNNRFTVTITDQSTGQTFSTSGNVNGQKSSAEWIAEAPSSSGGILPLADFGTTYYGSDNTGIGNTNFAKIGGVTGNIGSFGQSVQQITMVSQSNGQTKALPSSLSSDGTSFSMTWKSSGP